MNNRKHFKRFGQGVFTCQVCHRQTRDAGQGVDHLCPECYELAGYDNMVNDGGGLETLGEGERAEILALYKKAVKQGSNPERMKDQFAYLSELFAA